jgi:colanic acid/amylovoran biosynthesis protein
LLVSHTFGPPGNINSDPDACREVLRALPDIYKNRVHMVIGEYDQSELKGIINACNFFIGSRMHACIASLSQGIPTVAIAYSKKFIGVFDSIGSGDTVVDARELDEESAMSKIMQCYEKRNEIGLDAEVKVAAAKNRIKAVFKELISK